MSFTVNMDCLEQSEMFGEDVFVHFGRPVKLEGDDWSIRGIEVYSVASNLETLVELHGRYGHLAPARIERALRGSPGVRLTIGWLDKSPERGDQDGR